MSFLWILFKIISGLIMFLLVKIIVMFYAIKDFASLDYIYKVSTKNKLKQNQQFGSRRVWSKNQQHVFLKPYFRWWLTTRGNNFVKYLGYVFLSDGIPFYNCCENIVGKVINYYESLYLKKYFFVLYLGCCENIVCYSYTMILKLFVGILHYLFNWPGQEVGNRKLSNNRLNGSLQHFPPRQNLTTQIKLHFVIRQYYEYKVNVLHRKKVTKLITFNVLKRISR